MFSARPAATDASGPPPGPAARKNAAVKAFIQYSAFKACVACAAFLAAGG